MSLSSSLQKLVKKHIYSVGQLEVLLLLHSDSAQCWSAEAVSTQLRMTSQSVSNYLNLLVTSGFVSVVNQDNVSLFKYLPKFVEFEAQIDELSKIYATHRIQVIETIFPPDIDPTLLILGLFCQFFQFFNCIEFIWT